MKLREWRQANGISQKKFAVLADLEGKETVYRYEKGQHIPRPDVMKRIYQATNGEVRPDDWYDLTD